MALELWDTRPPAQAGHILRVDLIKAVTTLANRSGSSRYTKCPLFSNSTYRAWGSFSDSGRKPAGIDAPPCLPAITNAGIISAPKRGQRYRSTPAAITA